MNNIHKISWFDLQYKYFGILFAYIPIRIDNVGNLPQQISPARTWYFLVGHGIQLRKLILGHRFWKIAKLSFK